MCYGSEQKLLQNSVKPRRSITAAVYASFLDKSDTTNKNLTNSYIDKILDSKR